MLSRFHKNPKDIRRALLFIAAIAVVLYIFPRQGKFRYEYLPGIPWQHNPLIAPFNFPIYKTENELRLEKEQALSNFRPYFYVDTLVQQTAEKTLADVLNSSLEELELRYSFLNQSSQPDFSTKLVEEIRRLLGTIYSRGIISLPYELGDLTSTSEIMVVSGNFVERFEHGEFLIYQSAYSQLSSSLLSFLKENTGANVTTLDRFISDLQLNRFIKPNIIYDAKLSETEKQNLLRNVSLTSGIVLAGQRIIDTGEIISVEVAKIIDSLRLEHEARMGMGVNQIFVIMGQGLIVVLLFVFIFFFMYFFRKDVFNKLGSVLFTLIMVTSMLLLTRVAHSDNGFPVYIIPYAILPIIVRLFFDSRLAFFLHVSTILMAAFFAHNSFEFVILQIPVGLAAMFSLFRMVRRAQLLRSVLLVILTYSLFYTGLALWQEGDLQTIDYTRYYHFIVNGLMLMLIYPLIFIFEKLFGFLSDVTLIELADTNHPLLRTLSEKAPGTFQHSIQVGNLAQDAVYQIGGNPLLIRAGAMYHDIGKIDSPMFFTENQAGTINPHDNLPFEESARIVILHVENGVKLARKEKLPQQIINFITTHHGTMKAKYFFNSCMNQNLGMVPDSKPFTYPGPIPFTKETAVLMMADSIEAASRSLKSFTEDEIDSLVENIINDQIAEGQLIDSPVTFKEITLVKEVFKSKLKNIYHPRIDYPQLKDFSKLQS